MAKCTAQVVKLELARIADFLRYDEKAFAKLLAEKTEADIHYRFVGYVEIPEQSLCKNYIADTRQGVAVEYIPKASNA